MKMYRTCGKRVYPDFSLPVLYSFDPLLAPGKKNRFQILYVETGWIKLDLPRGRVLCSGPALVLINTRRSRLQGLRGSGGRLHNLVFSLEAINSAYRDPAVLREYDIFLFDVFFSPRKNGCLTIPLTQEGNVKFRFLFGRLDSMLNRQNNDAWPCLSKSYLIEILLFVYRLTTVPDNESGPVLAGTGAPVDEVLLYIHTHQNEKITVNGLAARFGTNRTSLNAVVREQTGLSVKAYVNSLRMETASNMLRNTRLAVREIASRVGFDDPGHFCRVFKKSMGDPPVAYRKKHPSPY